jgi:hypothetical protein
VRVPASIYNSLPMSTYDTLRQAISARKPCVISKRGEPERKVCPYRLGDSAEGDMNVLYYQYGGYTSRSGGLRPDGSSTNWRCNHVVDIEMARIIDDAWHGPTVKPQSRGPCVVDLVVEVSDYY